MNIIMKPSTVYLAALLVVFVTVFSLPAAAESGFTGMQIQGMSEKIAKALGRKAADGVLVRDVALGGPADRAGIHRGDLIFNANVTGCKIDCTAVFDDLGRYLFQFIALAADQDHLRAERCQFMCGTTAEATAAAGDDHGFALEEVWAKDGFIRHDHCFLEFCDRYRFIRAR